MSQKNSLESKRERRKIKYLRNLTWTWNQISYKMIDGHQCPFKRPYRNFIEEYHQGKLQLIRKGGDYTMFDENGSSTPAAGATPVVPSEPAVGAPETTVAPTEPTVPGEPTPETPPTPAA